MKHKKCLVCKKQFNKTPNYSLKSWSKAKFCSLNCYSKYRSLYYKGKKHPGYKDGRSNEKKECPICKKEFYGVRNKIFCNTTCMGKHQTLKGTNRGKNNGMYKGGRISAGLGYIKVLIPEHPNANRRYVLEHHLIMEKKIGRYLQKGEIVHHINEIKNDNRIENLQLMTRQEHDRFHCITRKKTGNFLRIEFKNGIKLKCKYCSKVEVRHFQRKNITCIQCQKLQQKERARRWELNKQKKLTLPSQ